jgi:hypothetical protein
MVVAAAAQLSRCHAISIRLSQLRNGLSLVHFSLRWRLVEEPVGSPINFMPLNFSLPFVSAGAGVITHIFLSVSKVAHIFCACVAHLGVIDDHSPAPALAARPRGSHAERLPDDNPDAALYTALDLSIRQTTVRTSDTLVCMSAASRLAVSQAPQANPVYGPWWVGRRRPTHDIVGALGDKAPVRPDAAHPTNRAGKATRSLPCAPHGAAWVPRVATDVYSDARVYAGLALGVQVVMASLHPAGFKLP